MENNPLKRVFNRFFGSAGRVDLGAGTDGGLRVAAVMDVPEDRPLCVDVGGRELAVFRYGGRYIALANACTHLGGPLCQGQVVAGAVTCPWHGAKFRIATGEVVGGPARKGVAAYELEARGEDLYLVNVG